MHRTIEVIEGHTFILEDLDMGSPWPPDSVPVDDHIKPPAGRADSPRKETNPKDAVGIKKVPFSTVSALIIAEIGLGMLEGARKYGRHNYRIAGVRASVYYDAAMRHLAAWWEGQDIDPDSGLPHIVKAMSTLAVLRDAQHNGKMFDDRPPSVIDQDWMTRMNAKAAEIIERYPVPVAPFTIADKIVPDTL